MVYRLLKESIKLPKRKGLGFPSPDIDPCCYFLTVIVLAFEAAPQVTAVVPS